jgi:hypothetical protein
MAVPVLPAIIESPIVTGSVPPEMPPPVPVVTVFPVIVDSIMVIGALEKSSKTPIPPPDPAATVLLAIVEFVILTGAVPFSYAYS